MIPRAPWSIPVVSKPMASFATHWGSHAQKKKGSAIQLKWRKCTYYLWWFHGIYIYLWFSPRKIFNDWLMIGGNFLHRSFQVLPFPALALFRRVPELLLPPSFLFSLLMTVHCSCVFLFFCFCTCLLLLRFYCILTVPALQLFSWQRAPFSLASLWMIGFGAIAAPSLATVGWLITVFKSHFGGGGVACSPRSNLFPIQCLPIFR